VEYVVPPEAHEVSQIGLLRLAPLALLAERNARSRSDHASAAPAASEPVSAAATMRSSAREPEELSVNAFACRRLGQAAARWRSS
jgi:hypothetical protein